MTRTIESPHPNAVEAALLRGLEEQNNALQTHVAWLSKELSRVSADEVRSRDTLATLTARFNPSSAISVQEVQTLQARVQELGDALSTQTARANAAESVATQLQSRLAKREDQVMQLSTQLGRAAAHIKEQANSVAGWSERQPAPAQPLASDLTEAKFEMQQRIITSLTQQLAEANLELGGCKRAADIWEARHMMWEQAVESGVETLPRKTDAVALRRNGSGANFRRGEEAVEEAVSTSSLKTQRSLQEAERAWQERCEQQRRRETTGA
jgi:chromosome segregation ATPase